MSDRLPPPAVVERFAAYHEKNPAWGSLHIVMEDGNWAPQHIEWCIEWAKQQGDTEGEQLAWMLLAMSRRRGGAIVRECDRRWFARVAQERS